MQQSLQSFRQGLTELAESRQQDSRSTGLEAVLRLWMAGALEKNRDVSAALQHYVWVKDYYSRKCAADPQDFEDCLSLAGVLDRVGRIHLQRGHLDEALAEYERALAIAEPPSVGAKSNLEALYTIVNIYFGLGEVHTAIDAKARSLGRPGAMKQACSWYQKSQSAFQRIPEWLPITPNEYESRPPNDIRDRLSRCNPVADTT